MDLNKELNNEYRVETGQRQQLSNGSVKYPVKVICETNGETITDTTYTVSKRQEEKIEKILSNFGKKKALEYEENRGKDASNTQIKV